MALGGSVHCIVGGCVSLSGEAHGVLDPFGTYRIRRSNTDYLSDVVCFSNGGVVVNTSIQYALAYKTASMPVVVLPDSQSKSGLPKLVAFGGLYAFLPSVVEQDRSILKREREHGSVCTSCEITELK